MKKSSLLNRKIFYPALLIAGVIAGGVIFNLSSPADPDPFMSVSGLPSGTVITAQAGADVLDFIASDDLAIAHHPGLQGSYKIETSLKFPDETHADIELLLDQQSPKIFIEARGFSDYSSLSLSFGERQMLDAVPFDWSGKLELDVLYPANTDETICLHAAGDTPQTELKLCHRIGRRNVS